VKSKTDASREIADRLEGKAQQPIELTGKNGGPINLAERIARARARVEEYRQPRPQRLGGQSQIEQP